MSASLASLFCFRHEVFCRPGMWLSNLSAALGIYGHWKGPVHQDWHVHAHCVVDDFGNLVPVAIIGMTATKELIGSVS